MFRITPSQAAALSAQVEARQRREAERDATDAVRACHAETAAALDQRGPAAVSAQFDRIAALTRDRLMRRALLAIWADTGIDVFDHPAFSGLLDHPFLTGDAKARHIIASAVIASPRNRETFG